MMDATSTETDVLAGTAAAGASPGINDQGLCERCASIPWEKLAAASNLHDKLVFPIDQRLIDLEQSRCRVCRLFGSTALTHGFIYYPDPYMLRQCDTDVFDSPRCKGLYLDDPSPSSPEAAFGHPRYPRLVITNLDDEQAQSRLQHVYPDLIDMNLVGSWLHECSACHGDPCTPLFTKSLEGLKVINCVRRSVEPAPPNCQYVALSYVWGQHETTFELTHGHELEQVQPKTIEDSITVTLSLGYTYLWIDRYVCF
jgi:hypothetical protein